MARKARKKSAAKAKKKSAAVTKKKRKTTRKTVAKNKSKLAARKKPARKAKSKPKGVIAKIIADFKALVATLTDAERLHRKLEPRGSPESES
jgi:hypothetical protein